ncbi:MAG: DUF3102 domain-containing protein [Clostridium sp.]
MNEVTRPLEVIETEINFYKQQTASGIIEIGKRLIEAKKQLGEGESFRAWCKKMDFSKSSAYRFMRVANEFSSVPTLGQSKIFALLDVPIEEREEFINSTHEVNGEQKTVDEMTARELQKAIKERDQYKKEVDKISSQKDKVSKEKNKLEKENEKLQGLAQAEKIKAVNEKERAEKLEEELGLLQERFNVQEADKASELEALRSELAEKQSEIEELKNKPIEVTYAEPNPEDIAEKEELKKKLEKAETEKQESLSKLESEKAALENKVKILTEKVNQPKNDEKIKFEFYFNSIVSDFKNILHILNSMDETDREKYKNAVSGVIGKINEKLS